MILDVTSEGQLAAYAGSDSIMSGSIGYQINRGAATANFISYTQAVLVVTYTYDPATSDSFTNTVIYPLESRGTGDRGTRQAGQADDCALNNNCPLFDYNLDIPEFSTTTASSVQLSYWFSMFENAPGNGVRDVTTNVNIQNTDSLSASFIHEAALSDQANQPMMYFSPVSGHWENIARYFRVPLFHAQYQPHPLSNRRRSHRNLYRLHLGHR